MADFNRNARPASSESARCLFRRRASCELTECFKGFKRVGRVHDRRTGAHVDCPAQGFGHFFFGGAPLQRGFDMERYAVITAHRDRDTERDQLFDFRIECLTGRCRLGEAGEPSHLRRVGA